MADITKVTFHFNDGTSSRAISTPDSEALTVDTHEGYHRVCAAGVCIATALASLVQWYETDLVAPLVAP